MTFQIFHQVGHNAIWNLDSYIDDKCGTGLIFSPVHQKKTDIENIDINIKRESLFDPQYYLPSSQKPKLGTYPFFPETMSIEGFSTISYHALALKSAELCIDFQIEQEFSKIVIPLRYLNQMYPDYVEQQEAFSLHPFLEVIGQKEINKDLILTLPITHHMVMSPIFRNSLLNWITKYPEIDGIYLICCDERDSKQIHDSTYLLSLLQFVSEIKNTGLEIIIGYQNTESLIFTLIEDVGLTIGTFENTRIFSIDKFLVSDEEKRGPKPRIYLDGLLNWIQFEQAKILRTKLPKIWDKIYVPTNHSESVFQKEVDPHFSQPGLYKHHFVRISEQIEELGKLDFVSRSNKLINWIDNAKSNYKSIDSMHIPIEKHGNGAHLEHWRKAITDFTKIS